ncbi:MAG: SDR family NAD(P)-dependent oxidoreductase [Alcanivorax sp.]
MSDDNDQNDASRRDFIKKAGMVAASGVAMATVPGVAHATANQAEKSIVANMKTKPLNGRSVLITGAARGIGLAMALKMAEDGANIALLDIAAPNAMQGIVNYALSSKEDLDMAVSLVKAKGVKAVPLIADVRSRSQMNDAVKQAVKALGRLDIVVANAGISNGDGFEKETDRIFQEIMNVNVTGVANTAHAAIPYLKQNKKGGRIIAISSVAGRRGVSQLTSYSASKWAVIGLVKSLALDLGEHNITVNAIAPTAVQTVMWRGADNGEMINKIKNSAMDMLVRNYHALPTGSIHPDEIANAAAFLASDNAKYVSGITLDVNAGWSGQMTG